MKKKKVMLALTTVAVVGAAMWAKKNPEVLENAKCKVKQLATKVAEM